MINKKLGYYVCDGIEFDSKIEACLYATEKNKSVSWFFNHEIFNHYDWSNEPGESLDELYDKRAKQIRDTYDYVIISYSGGADSHNLLMSFVRQDLHIDEIIVNTMEKGDRHYKIIRSNNFKSDAAPSHEHVFQTLPRLREISNKCPRTKIHILDLTDCLFEMLGKSKDESWIKDKKEKLHPANITRFNYLYFSEIKKKFDSNKNICIVLGIEKPRIYIHSQTKDIYLRFTDGAANTVGVISDYFKDYSNTTVEYFYWSPNSVDMICKQAHTIKNYLRFFPEQQSLWFGNKLTTKVYRLVHERIYRDLLYSTWNRDWFQGDKNVRDWFCEFDEWFIKDYADTKEFLIWESGLRYIQQHANRYIKYHDGKPDGLIMFHQDHKIVNLYEI